MKRSQPKFCIAVALCAFTLCCFSSSGHTADSLASADSTDIFWRHRSLKEVVVVGSTGATTLREATSAVSVLSSHDLRTAAAPNIVAAVAHLPGVAQLSTGAGIGKPVVRGMGYNRVLVVSDGVRQEGQQWGDEHGVEIDGSSVSSVEVLKGPATLVYGSDALAGVVRFNSTPIVPLGHIRANIATEYQSNNGLLSYSLNCGGNQRGITWVARYSEKFAHAYRNHRDGWVPGTQFHERAGRLMAGLNRNWGHARLIWTAYHLTPSIAEGERDETTGELVRPEGSITTYRKALPFQQVRHLKGVSDNLFYLGSSGKLALTVAYQLNHRREFEENSAEPGLNMKLHTVTGNATYSHQAGEWKLTAGLGTMFQKNVNHGDEFLISDHRLLDAGFFATASRAIGAVSVSGGVRYDHRHLVSHELIDDGATRFSAFTRNFGGVTGSLGAVWHLGESLNLRANVASGYRAPGISELAANGTHEGALRYEIGNPDLKSERSLQFDLGADYESAFWSAGVNLFANRVNNYIYLRRDQSARDESDGQRTFVYDSGTAQLLGAEITADIHPLHCLHIGAAFDIVNAVQLHKPHEAKYLPFTPAPRLKGDIKWEIFHAKGPVSNLYVAVNVEQRFRQSHVFEFGGTETPTGAYTLLGASAGCEITHKGRTAAAITIVLENATNKVYTSHLSRLKYAPENPVTHVQGVANMGRNLTIKLNVPLQWHLN